MSKTITLRVDEDFYEMIKAAAKGERRSISSLLEYSAIFYISNSSYVSDSEMKEILSDEDLVGSLRTGMQDIEKDEYEIVK
ncbi:MAG TPA: CopG family transcriptional regulator [Ignavibacteria bacterium]|nr:CopG family transcriptional regulator [Ignavibacteria bacterium]